MGWDLIILSTNIPGKWISSGCNNPGSTTSSASTIHILAALAQSGLKFLAVKLNEQFPNKSTFFAWIIA